MVETVTQMPRSAFRKKLLAMLARGPTVGALMDLCEGNFLMLARLMPEVTHMAGEYVSRPDGAAPLQLEVLEHTPYTSLVRLTHMFGHDAMREPDPDARLRIYHDARQAEVIDLRQSVLPLGRMYDAPGLVQKWRANHFAWRWLQFCLTQGHEFRLSTRSGRNAPDLTVPLPA